MKKNHEFDIYEAVTNRMIEELEKGTIPWEKPWICLNGGALKHKSGQPYSLLNQILLGEPGEYISFKECQEEGGRVKKGAKSRFVVFWKWLEYDQKGEDGKPVLNDAGYPVKDQVAYLRYYNVFNIRDCEAISPKWQKALNCTKSDDTAESVLSAYISRSGVGFSNELQDKACYMISQFTGASQYYSTAFHEAAHSTGHPSRLNRFAESSAYAAFGGEDYSKEELVAEISAAVILHEIGMETSSTFRNSVAYVQNWLESLKGDKKMIVSAAGRADKAVRMILGMEQPAHDTI